MRRHHHRVAAAAAALVDVKSSSGHKFELAEINLSSFINK